MDKYTFYEKNLKIEEKPIDNRTLPEYIAFDGSVHTSEESLRRANLAYFGKKEMMEALRRAELERITKLNLKENKNIIQKGFPFNLTYHEWDALRLYFMRCLSMNTMSLEQALESAKFLRDSAVTFVNIPEALTLIEQLNEILGIICALEEAQTQALYK
jgi:hypothetical protein